MTPPHRDPWARLRRGVARERIGDAGAFRRQIVVLTAILAGLAAITLVVVVQVVLAGTSSDAVQRVLTDRADTVATSVEAEPSTRSLTVPDTRLDPGVAVYDSTGQLIAGQAPARFADTFEGLSTTTSRVSADIGGDYRVLGSPFTTREGLRGVVVVAEPLAPYEKDERDALIVSAAAGLLIFLLTTGLAAWVTKRALAPVAQMARTAEEWSEHDLQRRFDLGAPDNEIRALGHTLDGLLDKVARTILAEQRLTAELAHELRTPLTAALGTADLVLMRHDLDAQVRQDVDQIAESCRAMADIVTSLLDLARTQASTQAPLVASRSKVIDGVEMAVAAHQGASANIEVRIADALSAAVPSDLVGRIIAPLLDNGLRLAEHVSIAATSDDLWVRIVVSDDGPGIAAELGDSIFQPGSSTGGGSGLGLALSRRIARTVGGDVEVMTRADELDLDGAHFEVRLPAST